MTRPNVSSMSFDELTEREWIATNGIGGYASSTIGGMNTRKYHGLLVAAMAPPVRRMVILAGVDEAVSAGGRYYALSTAEYPGVIHPHGYHNLRAFADEPFPRWAYQADGVTIEKSVRLLTGENTVCLTYTLLAGKQAVDLEIRPLMALRGFHELTFQGNGRLQTQGKNGQHRIPATSNTPEAFFSHDGQFAEEGVWYLNTIYRREQERGYAGLEDLWSPGRVRYSISPGQTVHFVCSTEPIDLDRVRAQLDRQSAPVAASALATVHESVAALERATAAFILEVPGEGGAARRPFVIERYPWSPPSPRASMTGFAGLFLVTGRAELGRRLLLRLTGELREGLLPSTFTEEGREPAYLGADVSLWFIHALGSYARYTGDDATVRSLLGVVEDIVESYRRGTALGIGCDDDGLVSTHAAGEATTWMDAKAGHEVMTPRQGRPVEINALWYNALRIAGEMFAAAGQTARADDLGALADRTRAAFNRRFWNEAAGCLYDVVGDDGADGSVRPNQLFAISLPHAVLDEDKRERVLSVVVDQLLTPAGVRTLSPRDSRYQGRSAGNAYTRERAGHNGAAYAWLLGPLVTAHVRVRGRTDEALTSARQWIAPSLERLSDAGMGQLPELFDGSPPHRPGGAVASALSVAELLRCLVEDVLGVQGQSRPAAVAPAVNVPTHEAV